MHRSWPALLTTGFLGGVEITIGLLAYLLALHETGSHLLAGVALSVGFIALFLAHSELFTEGFFYPIMAIVDGRGTWLELLRLWGVTLATNLLGGWVTVGLIALAFPQLHPDLAETAHHFLEIGLSWQGAALALLAGTAITLMTRMQAGAEDAPTRVAAAVAGAVVLGGGSLFHSVLDSVIMFGAIHSGAAGIDYLDWLGWIWWVIPLNILGGLLLTTGPRVLRSVEARD
ncbi:formate/nitrite transporter family protein [Klebsiella pneumoniae]|nr:formate/nitrite transporter family protein [Micrococcus luteus]RNP99747.1 formate/nitrite transporter family protein [Klebsiella pneumoniae]RUQ31907.1 formate/nitrite transporter family protein [Micrococcus sp. HSID17245]MCK6109697.1 formate/nitrite transporter family protein [Micrococcus luteus]MCZ6938525.1 formate/nitrite transporter family protein [Micrococcus luteus]